MKNIYKRYRFPPSIIQHAVWLYYRFNLSIRDVEDLMAQRNISVSYESIDFGSTNSVLNLPGDFGAGTQGSAILTFWMRCS